MTACGTRRAGMVAFLPAAVTLPAALLDPVAPAANSLNTLGADASIVQRALDLGTRCSDATFTAVRNGCLLPGVRSTL